MDPSPSLPLILQILRKISPVIRQTGALMIQKNDHSSVLHILSSYRNKPEIQRTWKMPLSQSPLRVGWDGVVENSAIPSSYTCTKVVVINKYRHTGACLVVCQPVWNFYMHNIGLLVSCCRNHANCLQQSEPVHTYFYLCLVNKVTGRSHDAAWLLLLNLPMDISRSPIASLPPLRLALAVAAVWTISPLGRVEGEIYCSVTLHIGYKRLSVLPHIAKADTARKGGERRTTCR